MIKKWNGWFNTICQDVFTLYFYRMIYRDVGLIVNANPAIRKPNSFYMFVAGAYVTSTCIIIRRQVAGVKYYDKEHTWRLTNDNNSISLARLLLDISTHPQEISRERFHGFYAGQDFEEWEINKDFESAGVEAGRDSIDPASVLNDLAALEGVTTPLKKYTDKMIAHLDERKWTEAIPTFTDIDAAIDALAPVCDKFSVLLSGAGIANFEPRIEPNWEDVFTVPWISNPTHGQIQRMTHVS